MEKEKNIDLDEEEKGGVQGEEADDDTEKDDEFEYDDDGNIIIPDVIEDEDQDEDGDDNTADTDDDTDDEDEGEDGSDDEDKETPKPETQPEGKDEKDAQIEALTKELDALKAQSADTLAKLGVKSDNVLEGLEKVAAESDDMSLDEYRKKKAESQRDDAARKLLQQAEFEKKMQSDFAEIQREFPETRGMKSLREIENLAKFGRFRDLGLSPKEAYAAANPDSVRKSVAAATKQQSLNETKAHLKSAVPAGSKDDGIAISKKELREWRDLFPNLTDKEISRLYRESAKK
jgi:AAA ATPase containing von willebrand factor type A (VWA)-like domain